MVNIFDGGHSNNNLDDRLTFRYVILRENIREYTKVFSSIMNIIISSINQGILEIVPDLNIDGSEIKKTNIVYDIVHISYLPSSIYSEYDVGVGYGTRIYLDVMTGTSKRKPLLLGPMRKNIGVVHILFGKDVNLIGGKSYWKTLDRYIARENLSPSPLVLWPSFFGRLLSRVRGRLEEDNYTIVRYEEGKVPMITPVILNYTPAIYEVFDHSISDKNDKLKFINKIVSIIYASIVSSISVWVHDNYPFLRVRRAGNDDYKISLDNGKEYTLRYLSNSIIILDVRNSDRVSKIPNKNLANLARRLMNKDPWIDKELPQKIWGSVYYSPLIKKILEK